MFVAMSAPSQNLAGYLVEQATMAGARKHFRAYTEVSQRGMALQLSREGGHRRAVHDDSALELMSSLFCVLCLRMRARVECFRVCECTRTEATPMGRNRQHGEWQ